MILTLNFWKAALIRALYTILSTAIAVITTSGATTLQTVDWKMVLYTSILSGLISLLKSIAVGLPEVNIPELESKEEDIQ